MTDLVVIFTRFIIRSSQLIQSKTHVQLFPCQSIQKVKKRKQSYLRLRMTVNPKPVFFFCRTETYFCSMSKINKIQYKNTKKW